MMKKVLTLILAATLVLSLASTAFAATPSAAAREEDLLPKLRSSTCDQFMLYSMEDFDELPADPRKTIEEAMEKLPDAIPEGMRARYVFYADICETCDDCSAVFEPKHEWDAVVLQYVDGEWVELKVTTNEDGTITVDGFVDGPVALLIRQKPVVVESSCDQADVYTEEEVMENFSKKIQNLMTEAKKAISAVRPEGMLVRYFFYVDVCDTCQQASFDFLVDECNKMVIMQYINDAWTEVEFTTTEEINVIAVDGVVAAPMVIFAN